MGFKENFSAFMKNLAPVRSDWAFSTSANGAIAVETPIVHVGVNATAGGLWIKNIRDNTEVTLKYGGIGGSVGVGLVPCPIDFSFSIPQMPSRGIIFKLPYAGKTLSLNELKGEFVMLEISGDVGPGGSGALMFLGCSTFWSTLAGSLSFGALQVPALMATANACVMFGGMTVSIIPVSANVTVYVGAVI